jgi:hypothetical protein
VKGSLAFAVLTAAALAAVLAPSGGSSQPNATAACGREEFVGGLEAVFGRFTTLQAANSFRTRVVAAGFQNANVIPGCNEFRVVLRGIDSFDVGVDLQAEAVHEHFAPTLECIAAKDDVGELEAVFGHRRTRAEAQQLLGQAAAVGFIGLQLEADPCGGYEVMLKGFTGRDQAEDFVNEAKTAGFDVVIESS